MPNLNQVIVMNQREGSGGHESCGYHTLKNAVLSMMLMSQIIDKSQFQRLVKNKSFFEAFFVATRQEHHNSDADLSLPMFLGLLDRLKNGEFDFSAYGVSKTDLQKLKITMDGSQELTVANYTLYANAPGHGLGGMAEDLLVAAATAQLARCTGEAHHVFALGLNNTHWVCAAVKQNAQGERTWQFMDSLNNQKRYQAVIDRIEEVLTKTDSELEQYLIHAYEETHQFLMYRYIDFFDLETGLSLPNKVECIAPKPVDAREYFIDDKANMEQFTGWIENRIQFMKSAHWLTSSNPEIQAHVNQLYHLSRFLVEHTSEQDARDIAVKQRLQPIVAELKAALFPEADADQKLVNTLSEQQEAIQEVLEDENQTKENVLLQQQQETIQAIQERTPKPTEGFTTRFVNAIKAMIQGIVDGFRYIGQKLGIVS